MEWYRNSEWRCARSRLMAKQAFSNRKLSGNLNDELCGNCMVPAVFEFRQPTKHGSATWCWLPTYCVARNLLWMSQAVTLSLQRNHKVHLCPCLSASMFFHQCP
ncbi:hypothetical protein C0J52_12583 [Blattella germanica]|nr:hypothetical protein C0J52_12583 [Blattella germanica]